MPSSGCQIPRQASLRLSAAAYFASSPWSDHAAVGVMNVNLDELGRLPYLTEVARARWTRFLKAAAAGHAQAWMTGKFDSMFSARNLDELEDALYIS